MSDYDKFNRLQDELGFRIPDSKPSWMFEKNDNRVPRKNPLSIARTWVGTLLLECKKAYSTDSYRVDLSSYEMKGGNFKVLMSSTGLDKNEAESIYQRAKDILK